MVVPVLGVVVEIQLVKELRMEEQVVLMVAQEVLQKVVILAQLEEKDKERRLVNLVKVMDNYMPAVEQVGVEAEAVLAVLVAAEMVVLQAELTQAAEEELFIVVITVP